MTTIKDVVVRKPDQQEIEKCKSRAKFQLSFFRLKTGEIK